MSGLLALDPSQRMTCQQCLEHPYLRDLWLADTRASGEYAGSTNILTHLPGYDSGMLVDAACDGPQAGVGPGPDYGVAEQQLLPGDNQAAVPRDSAQNSATHFDLHPDLMALDEADAVADTASS